MQRTTIHNEALGSVQFYVALVRKTDALILIAFLDGGIPLYIICIYAI
jgi:hypothetical protein